MSVSLFFVTCFEIMSKWEILVTQSSSMQLRLPWRDFFFLFLTEFKEGKVLQLYCIYTWIIIYIYIYINGYSAIIFKRLPLFLERFCFSGGIIVNIVAIRKFKVCLPVWIFDFAIIYIKNDPVPRILDMFLL